MEGLSRAPSTGGWAILGGMDAYGRYGEFQAQAGKGQLLASLLLEAAEILADDPDCRLYVVNRSPERPETVGVYEAWASREAHEASLQDERVTDLIGRARPLIADVGNTMEFIPVGGKGFAPGE